MPIVSSSGPSAFHDESRAAAPGVVTGRYGTIGRVFYVTEPFWPLNTTLYVRDFHGNNPRFVYYLLQTIDFESCNDKSGVPGVNRNDLHRISVDLPTDVGEQRAIAEVLGALEDKIELNRQMNHTLEEMASALFKSWFIDFDPVVAKADDRKPFGMDAATAALFPRGFTATALGTTPLGWRASTIGSEVRRCGGLLQTGPFGSQLHASDYVSSGVPVVMPQDIVRRRVQTEKIARISEDMAQSLARHRLTSGDIVHSRRGDVERHAFVGARETGWLCGTGCLLIRMGPRWQAPEYVSWTLATPDVRDWLTRHAVGGTMPNLNTSILGEVPILVPSDEVLQAFHLSVFTWAELSDAMNAESHTLTTLRDALLPKLLSGEIRLKQAEKLVEAAT